MSKPADAMAAAPVASGLRALVRAIVDYAGVGHLISALIIVSLAAVLEGAGIILLLPVAETIFAQSEGARQSGVTAEVIEFLRGYGVDTVFRQLVLMGSAFVMLVALRALVLLRRDVLLSRLSYGFVDHERQRFFAMLAAAEWPVIKRYRKSQLLDTMTTNIGRLAHTMSVLSHCLIAAALGLAALGAAFLVSTTIGVMLLIMLVGGMVFALLWSRRSYRAGERLGLANRGIMQETTRFLDGLKAAKAARAEEELTSRFVQRITETRDIYVAFIGQQSRLKNLIQLLASLFALLVLLVGFGWLGLSGGELLVMAAIILRLAPTFLLTFSSIQTLAHALPAFTALRDLEDDMAEAHDALQIPRQRDAADDVVQAAEEPLEFHDCSVRVLNEEGEPVSLVKIGHLSIPPGTMVHIRGPSGSGKSSLVELAAGLHLPATGELVRGPLKLTARTCRAWQSQVSFAPQEPFLFDATVRENLCWPNLSPSDEAIWEALAIAQADKLVAALPKGLEQELLDGGARLSGGERQRLCIARALLRPASLLIFDEATSAMDPELERAILAKLKQVGGQRIVLMVSHSLNTLDLADMQIEVVGGQARLTG